MKSFNMAVHQSTDILKEKSRWPVFVDPSNETVDHCPPSIENPKASTSSRKRLAREPRYEQVAARAVHELR